MAEVDKMPAETIAPQQMQPYAAQFELTAAEVIYAPRNLIVALIDDIGRRCKEAGCSIIGHIKCHARVGESRMHCNLTSLRHGAHCGSSDADRPDCLQQMRPGDLLEMDVAVLVYGLRSAAIEELVRDALRASVESEAAQSRLGVWNVRLHGHSHHCSC
jgi:hypothetical protein